MNKLLLYLIMLPGALWKGLGADMVQLRAILTAKLTLDDRKPMAIGRQKRVKSMKFGSILSALLYVCMGFFYSFPLFIVSDRIVSLTLYYSLLLSMLTFMLITDFSSVLFDSRDKYIIFPRPVNDRTLVLARLLHVLIYLLRIIIPLTAPALIVLLINDGMVSGILFLLPTLLLVFLALFFVNGIYLLVLKLTRAEKFKDVINYFQVFTSVLFFATFYLLPRMFDREENMTINLAKYPWVRFTPPYWLASCWTWTGVKAPFAGSGVFSLLAIAVPLVCVYLLVKVLAPSFAAKIAGIDAVEGSETRPGNVKKSKPGGLYQRLAIAFNKSDDARAGFMIAWLQSSRSRSFRMRVYPSFAFIPIYFIYMITQSNRSWDEIVHKLPEKPIHLFLLYFSAFVMISALNYLAISDQYKAAWVYYATPVQVPGRIMMGAFKAMWVKFFLPFFALLSIFVLYIWGAPAILDIILALVNVTLFVSAMARVNIRHLPFSIVEQAKQGGSRVLKSILSMSVMGILGVGHYGCCHFHLEWLKVIFLALSCVMLWLVCTSYASTTWSNMIQSETE